MKYLSTFSGVGGMDLGFDRAGMTCGTKASDTDAERLSDWQREHEAGCG